MYVNAFYNTGRTKAPTNNNAQSTSTKGETINTTINTFISQSNDKNNGFEAFFGRRLKKQGRSFTLGLNYANSNNKAFDTNKGETVFYKTNGGTTKDTLDQQGHTTGDNTQLNLTASWIEPITTKLNVVLLYNYTNGLGHNNKATNRYNPTTMQYDIPDTVYSNIVRNHHRTHMPNLLFNYNTEKSMDQLARACNGWNRKTNQRPTKATWPNVLPTFFLPPILATGSAKPAILILTIADEASNPP